MYILRVYVFTYALPGSNPGQQYRQFDMFRAEFTFKVITVKPTKVNFPK